MDAGIRSRALLISLLIHGALLLALIFIVMTTAVPPFPETGGGGGVLVSIGTVDEASGDVQPMSDNTTTDPSLVNVKPTAAPEELLATQEFEESPVVKEKKEDLKTDIKPAKTEVKPVKVEKKVVEQPRTADPRAIYKGKTTDSQSQGTGTGKGDEGDPAGDPNSIYKGKNGTGGGSGGGSGTGTGDGEGPGVGSGKGGGVSFSLTGRRWMRTPTISDQSQETGKVVVDITVDKDGNVVSAIPGGRGSTTTSSYLFRLAKEAAMKAKFNSSPEGADIQRGTITFVFVVQ